MVCESCAILCNPVHTAFVTRLVLHLKYRLIPALHSLYRCIAYCCYCEQQELRYIMSNGTLLDSTHKLNKTKDDTEVTLNVIPDLLDNIERDLKVIVFYTTDIYTASLNLAYCMPRLDHYCP